MPNDDEEEEEEEEEEKGLKNARSLFSELELRE
jgi:hypothetical protein